MNDARPSPPADATSERIAAGLAEIARTVGIDAPAPDVVERLARYTALVMRWNGPYNLVGAVGAEAFVQRHLLDSMAAAIRLAPGTVVDVGSGAGLPGLVVAAIDPARRVVLVDSRLKRTRFLTTARRELGLAHVTVVRARVETLTPEDVGGVPDVVTARAFSTLAELARLTVGLRDARTRIQALKARPDDAELDAARAFGFTVDREAYDVPGLNAARCLVTLTPGGQHAR